MRIDTHVHLWDPTRVPMPWLDQAPPALQRAFTPDDLEPELVATATTEVVLVEAVADLVGTRELLATARRWSPVAGVVGWAPLDRPDVVAELLDDPEAGALVGLRHPVHTDPDPAWLEGPRISEGLELLAAHGRCFDLVAAGPHHLWQAATRAASLPGLRIVIDHLGAPPARATTSSDWADAMRALAALPEVAVKLSGITTLAPGGGDDPMLVRPAVELVLELFGPSRCMLGSDWPVSTLATSYSQTMVVLERLVAHLAPEERAEVASLTARRVYRLGRSATAQASVR